MKRVIFLWFFAVSSLLFTMESGGAEENYKVEIWNTDNGLPMNTVVSLAQTPDKYLWIGTLDGLVRFDGVHFEIYNRETTPQLNSNEIYALYVDKSGVLWIGTSIGGLIRYKDGQFFTYPVEENNSLSRIWSISEDRWGNLWIASNSEGLTCLNNGNFINYTMKNGLPGNEVRKLYIDGNQDLWAAVSNGIVKLLEPGIFQNYSPKELIPNLKTTCLYERDSGVLWIGTGDKGLFKVKNEKVTPSGIGTDIPPGSINILYKDRKENLWIGTDGAGLVQLNRGTVLDCGPVYAITEDNADGLWVGTLERGLFRLSDKRFSTLSANEGLSHDIAHCVYQDSHESIWIGTKGGLDRLIKGKPSRVLTTNDGLLSNSISCLLEDSIGNLWIGTWGGLHKYRNRKLIHLTEKNGLSDSRVRCLLEDKKGTIWIGTENGLNRYDQTTGQFRLFTKEQGLCGNSIGFILENQEGDLLVGSIGGMDCIKNGEIIKCLFTIEKNEYLLECAYEDRQGMLWLGTDRGLMLVKTIASGEKQKVQRERLTEIEVGTICEDDQGNLWLGGRKGISRVAKKDLIAFTQGKTQELILQTYSEKDGMKSRWCNGVVCRSGDGRLWFPTSLGVVVVEPKTIQPEPVVSAPIIEKFIVDGEMVKMKKNEIKEQGHGKDKKIESNLSRLLFHSLNVDSLELPPGKKRLEIHYTAVNFNNPQKVRFKIKLEACDTEWVEVGNQRNAVYIGLKPGNYTFKVAAGNREGEWNTAETAFSFYLRPYFYQTKWFYLLVILIVLISAFSYYRIRIRHLKKREKELSELVDEQTRDLKERTVQLETAHHKLQQSNEIIETKNRHIMDSIRYAQRIQQAMLPTQEKMANQLSEYFVVFKPKDIVSGDFYWFDIIENYYFIAVADCTGHGVPGALLSMIGYMMLNEIVEDKRIFDPAQVLCHLHQGFRSVLKQELNHEETDPYDTYDGMDLGLCRIDLDTGKITFAGAGLSLFYTKNSELVEIKGNRKSIGGRQREKKRSYSNNPIDIPIGETCKEGIMIYMTTDGFSDQHNPFNHKFGSRQLKELLRHNAHLKADIQKEALLNALAEHQENEEQRDDITVIGMRLRLNRT